MIVAITRTRLRSFRFFIPLLIASNKIAREVRQNLGFVVGNTFVEPFRLVFWTVTVWTDEKSFYQFLGNGVHVRQMPKQRYWAEESVVAHILTEQKNAPNIEECRSILLEQGKRGHVLSPNENHKNKVVPQHGWYFKSKI